MRPYAREQFRRNPFQRHDLPSAQSLRGFTPAAFQSQQRGRGAGLTHTHTKRT